MGHIHAEDSHGKSVWGCSHNDMYNIEFSLWARHNTKCLSQRVHPKISIFFTIMVDEWLTMILPTPLTYKGEYPHLWGDIKGSSLLYKMWGLDKKRMYRKCRKWSCDKEPREWVEKRNRGDVWVTFGIATRRVKCWELMGEGWKCGSDGRSGIFRYLLGIGYVLILLWLFLKRINKMWRTSIYF